MSAMLPRRLLLTETAAWGGAAVAALTLGGCSVLPGAAYVKRTEWPLVVRRRVALAARPGGKVLVVRSLTPAPGLERRGVQWLRPDGSLHVDYYNQWAVPPAEGITDDLRRWLAGSGRFGAVLGPDSGVAGDLALEGEVTEFLGDPALGVARVSLALVLIAARASPAKVLVQRTVTAQAPIHGTTPAALVAALLAALRGALGQAETAVQRFAGAGAAARAKA